MPGAGGRRRADGGIAFGLKRIWARKSRFPRGRGVPPTGVSGPRRGARRQSSRFVVFKGSVSRPFGGRRRGIPVHGADRVSSIIRAGIMHRLPVRQNTAQPDSLNSLRLSVFAITGQPHAVTTWGCSHSPRHSDLVLYPAFKRRRRQAGKGKRLPRLLAGPANLRAHPSATAPTLPHPCWRSQIS